ncbi:MAG: GAF domain-containing protein, partial [Anaerolineales bacterium]
LIIVTGVLFVALLAYGVYPILGLRWSRQPFLGVLIEQTLVFSDLQSTNPGAWDVRSEVDQFGYQIRSLNDFPINDHGDLLEWLTQAEIGQQVELAWRHINPDIGSGTFETTLSKFPTVDLISFLVVPYAIGLTYLVLGLWVFWLRRQEPAGRVFPLFAASIAIVLGGLFDLSTTHQLTRLWTLALGTAGGALLGLGMVFPQPLQILKRHPGLHWVPIAIGAFLGLVSQFWIFDLTSPTAYVGWWKASYFYNGLGIVGFLVTMAIMLRRAASPVVRQQIRTILIGAMFAFLPIGLWFLMTAVFPTIRINIRWVIPSLVFFPIAITYSIMRYRWMRTDTLVVRGLTYATLVVVSSLGYAFILAVASLILGSRIPADNPVTVGIFVLIMVAIFSPLREQVQTWLSRVFSRSSETYQEHLERLSSLLTEAIDIHTISNQLRDQLRQAINPEELHIFMYDAVHEAYIGAAGEKHPASELHFTRNSDFIRFISQSHSCVYITPGEPLPEGVGADKAKIEVLNALVFVPMIGQDRLEGWIALGERESGLPYGIEELEFIEAMAAQAGLGLSRAQIVTGLNRRVVQLEVLSRLAQDAAAAASADELFDLIFTQTNQLIPTQNLSIATLDPAGDTLSYNLLVVDNQRLQPEEGKPIPSNQGLLPEVIRQSVPLRVDNYQWECNSRNLNIDYNYRAWVGAPLTIKAGIIGAIGLGSTHMEASFTHQQLELLKAIADLTATAIHRIRGQSLTVERSRETEGVDRELASRIEELDLIHRIDQLMITRQPPQQIMEHTLKACINHTGAGAGLIALLDGGELKTLTSQGYPDGVRPSNHLVVPEQINELKASMLRGEPVRFDDLPPDAAARGLHPNSRSLISVPIFFEGNSVGAILLEAINPDVFRTQHLTFIRRLMDHAALALGSARLEAELTSARQSNSQLMSVVSQSIKSPLLAIKDNAEALLDDAQVRLNEAQRSRLLLIRTSVDRIVKLLLDLAKSRPGRPQE